MMMMMKRESLLSRRRCASNPLQSRCESVRASYWPIGDRSSPSKPGIVDQVASFYFKLALGFQYLEGSLQIGLPLVFVPRPINCADCSLAFGFVPWLFSFFLSFFWPPDLLEGSRVAFSKTTRSIERLICVWFGYHFLGDKRGPLKPKHFYRVIPSFFLSKKNSRAQTTRAGHMPNTTI